MNFEDRLDETLEEIKDLLIAKNKSYGDAALDPVNIFSDSTPKEAIAIRIDDKLKRIKNGSSYEQEDTKLDLIGYLILDRVNEKS